MTIDAMPNSIAARCCIRVAELDDRDSLGDSPAAMVVTAAELHAIVQEEITPVADECMRLYRELASAEVAWEEMLHDIVREQREAVTQAMNEGSVMVEDVETAERIADTMRDMVDDMTAEVQRLRNRVKNCLVWGSMGALVLLSALGYWRAYA